MTRTPTLSCASCGKPMWKASKGRGLPQGECLCRDCRRQRERETCKRCERPTLARGLCSTHYSYWFRRQSGEWGPDYNVSREVRLAIYERDNWTCQLCSHPVDRDLDPVRDALAATLDHIIPQSRQLVPDHSVANLRLAHRICNSKRGDRLDGAPV